MTPKQVSSVLKSFWLVEAFQLIPSASFISSFVSGSIIAGAVTVGEGSKPELRTKDEAAMIEIISRDHGSLDEVLSTEMIGICHNILGDVQFQHKQVERYRMMIRETQGLTRICGFSADKLARRFKAM